MPFHRLTSHRTLTAIVLSATLLGCAGPDAPPPPPATDDAPANAPARSPAVFTATVIDAEGGTYGYRITRDGTALIEQSTVPGRPGTTGFRTPEDAERVAQAVVRKLQEGSMPPTITEEDLQALGIAP
ncbi:MAG: DUF4907 domain-containing protein [Flavobacteriales bacterium]|nr:DUF4907 domain-containing protein [Flavobacteriales bacterium]